MRGAGYDRLPSRSVRLATQYTMGPRENQYARDRKQANPWARTKRASEDRVQKHQDAEPDLEQPYASHSAAHQQLAPP